MSENGTKLLTVGEVAALLRVGPRFVYRCKSLPAVRVGRLRRYEMAAVLAWIARQREGGTENAAPRLH